MIIVFNTGLFQALPYVDLLYRPFFLSILYCAHARPEENKFPHLFDASGSIKYSFTMYPHKPATTPDFYACVKQALYMRYDVDGYFVIGDDTLVSLDIIRNFDVRIAWISNASTITDLTTLKPCRGQTCDVNSTWAGWPQRRKDVLQLFEYLGNEAQPASLAGRCYEQLVNVTGGKRRSFVTNVDAFYIPQRLAPQFAQLTDLMLRFHVYIENAIPIMIWCLEKQDRVQVMSSYLDWSVARYKPWEVFKERKGFAYYHPMKWGLITNATDGPNTTCVFCHDVIPHLHKRNDTFHH